MEFIEKKYLFRQHRFIDKAHPVHLQRLAYLREKKRIFHALDNQTYYDRYFIFWLSGFFEKSGYLKIIKKIKFNFSCLLFHLQYKLLRWIRYQLNFGLVLFNIKKVKFFFFVHQRQHVEILVDAFMQGLAFMRTVRQFFIWAKYFNLSAYRQNLRSTLHFAFPQYVHKGFFFGLIDNCGRFKIYSTRSNTARFKMSFRFIFYCDLPLQENWFFKFLFKVFVFPTFVVRSSLSMRIYLNAREDCVTLSRILFRQKLFNRVLRMNFLNWFATFDYLLLRPIKYRRKDYFKELLHYFYVSSYYV